MLTTTYFLMTDLVLLILILAVVMNQSRNRWLYFGLTTLICLQGLFKVAYYEPFSARENGWSVVNETEEPVRVYLMQENSQDGQVGFYTKLGPSQKENISMTSNAGAFDRVLVVYKSQYFELNYKPNPGRKLIARTDLFDRKPDNGYLYSAIRQANQDRLATKATAMISPFMILFLWIFRLRRTKQGNSFD